MELKNRIDAKVKGWFENITEENLPRGLVIVFIIALLELIDAYIRIIYVNQGSTSLGLIAVGLKFVASITSWFIFTIVIHYISIFLGGKGGLKRFFALCGFAYLPIVIQKIGQIIIDYIERDSLAQSIIVEPNIIGLLLTHFNIFKIVVLFLVAIAVMTNYGLNKKKALIATLFPDLFSIVLVIVLRTFNLGGFRRPFLRQ